MQIISSIFINIVDSIRLLIKLIILHHQVMKLGVVCGVAVSVLQVAQEI
jgi:hypothetical protein